MFESLFRFLFKYPPLVFQQGDLAWGVSRPLLLAIFVAVGVAVAALLTYKTTSAEQPLRDRAVLIGLRIAILALLVVCLFRPTLVL